MAFLLVEKQRESGEIVSGQNIARLVETLFAYFRSVGRPRTRKALSEQIEKYVRENSLADAESISPTRLPVSVAAPLLDELRRIDEEMRERFVDMHGQPAGTEWLGLWLGNGLDDHRYGHCTPLNCRTFAGRDGNHFSFLVVDGAITASSPIVATCPGGFEIPSAVIAESLEQFLRLGCVNGYGSLGGLFLGPDEELSRFLTTEQTSDEFVCFDFESEMLAYLRQRLNLKQWTDWRALRAIQEKYKGALRHPPGAIC